MPSVAGNISEKEVLHTQVKFLKLIERHQILMLALDKQIANQQDITGWHQKVF